MENKDKGMFTLETERRKTKQQQSCKEKESAWFPPPRN